MTAVTSLYPGFIRPAKRYQEQPYPHEARAQPLVQREGPQKGSQVPAHEFDHKAQRSVAQEIGCQKVSTKAGGCEGHPDQYSRQQQIGTDQVQLCRVDGEIQVPASG